MSSDTSHHVQEVIPLEGVGHSVDIHLWPKIYLWIYRPAKFAENTIVSGVPFNMPRQIWTPVMNRHNSQDSLKVLTDYQSLSKNMKTLLFAQHTHLCVMFETQNSLWINTWYSWVILLTLEYMQYMWFSYLINISKLSPLEYTEISTVLIPFALEAILVQFSHNLYVHKIVQMSHSFTYSLRPMIYIINKFLKYYSINDQFV